MRILMVNLTDWSAMSGGAQHQLGLFEAFRAAGNQVRVLTVGSGDSPAMPFGMREVATLVSGPKRFGFPANLDTLAQLPALVREIMTFRPDVVYSRANALSIAVVAVAKLFGTRVVLEHNSWLESQRRVGGGSAWLARLERLMQIGAARMADASRCVTQGLANRLAQSGVAANRLHAIGNGTDCEQFFPVDRKTALRQFGLPEDRTYVGFIGNIMPWHGLTTALEGFAELAGSHPATDLLVFGDGLGLAPLAEMARRLGLADRVRLMGKVPFASANMAINCFDLAILPLSLRHDIGFGFSAIKLRDYAAAGRIVLTGLVPGNIELCAEPWLLTHAPDDAGDFASALGVWLESQAGDRGHWAGARLRARSYAEQNFAWTRVAARIAEVFANLEDSLPGRSIAPAGQHTNTALQS